MVPALLQDLVLVLLGSLTAALQGQDTALERKARASRVGRCHAWIGFPQHGILSFLLCYPQGPKHCAMGSIAARLLQNCILGHREDAGAPHTPHPGHPALMRHCAAPLCPAHEEHESSLPLLLGVAPHDSLEATCSAVKTICREVLLF